MSNPYDDDRLFADELKNALSDIYSEFGSGPSNDEYEALEAYHAYDDGTLAEAPQALAAYVSFQQQSID